MMGSLTIVRKVFHATVFSIILVSVITIIIIFAIAAKRTDVCGIGDLKKVGDLRVDVKANTIRVSWAYNTTCNVLYNVRHEVDGFIIRNVFRRDNYIELEKNTCTNNNITVTVRTVAGVSGEPATEHVEVGHNALGPVRNLVYENGRLEWHRPVDALRCDLTYEVTVQNDFDVIKNQTTSNYLEIELHPCSSNRIQVTPIVLDDRGEKTMLNQIVNPAMNGPVHVWTEPYTNQATVLWQLNRPQHNVCKVLGLLINHPYGDEIFEELDTATSKSTAIIDGLKQNTIYSYTARWVLEGGHFSNISEMRFLTVPLTEPTKLEADREADRFRMHWDQTYDEEFVKGHRIYISSLGPIHFVPESCPRNNSIFVSDVSTSVTQFDFEYALPSHKYKVELFTIFTVGLERSNTYTVTTLETDPEQLDLTTSFVIQRGIAYNVTGEISWPVPCKINGELLEFRYIVTGSLYPDLCEWTTSYVIEAQTEQDTYVITLPDLIPFFQYTIEIETFLTDHSTLSEDTFRAPDGYTPPATTET